LEVGGGPLRPSLMTIPAGRVELKEAAGPKGARSEDLLRDKWRIDQLLGGAGAAWRLVLRGHHRNGKKKTARRSRFVCTRSRRWWGPEHAGAICARGGVFYLANKGETFPGAASILDGRTFRRRDQNLREAPWFPW